MGGGRKILNSIMLHSGSSTDSHFSQLAKVNVACQINCSFINLYGAPLLRSKNMKIAAWKTLDTKK